MSKPLFSLINKSIDNIMYNSPQRNSAQPLISLTIEQLVQHLGEGMRSASDWLRDHNLEKVDQTGIITPPDTRSPFHTSTLFRYTLSTYNLQLLIDSLNPNYEHIQTTRLFVSSLLILLNPLIHTSLSLHLKSSVIYSHYSVSCAYTHTYSTTCRHTSLGLILKMKRKRR